MQDAHGMVGLYPLAEESGFLTPSTASAVGSQFSEHESVEDEPSSGAAEVLQNLFRIWTMALKLGFYEQSTTEGGETMKTVLRMRLSNLA